MKIKKFRVNCIKWVAIFILLPLGGIVSDVIENLVVRIFIPDDVFVIVALPDIISQSQMAGLSDDRGLETANNGANGCGRRP